MNLHSFHIKSRSKSSIHPKKSSFSLTNLSVPPKKTSCSIVFLHFFQPFPGIPGGSPGDPQAAQRILAALREAHGGRVECGGAAEVPNVAKAERFVQPTIVVDPKKES